MRRMGTVPLTLLAFTFTAAGAPAVHAQGTPSASGAATVTAEAPAARKPNLRACFDGRCKITISRPVSFRISSRYGFSRISIARKPGRLVQVTGRHAGGFAQATLGKGGLATLNNLSVRVLSVTRTKATLRFAPAR